MKASDAVTRDTTFQGAKFTGPAVFVVTNCVFAGGRWSWPASDADLPVKRFENCLFIDCEFEEIALHQEAA